MPVHGGVQPSSPSSRLTPFLVCCLQFLKMESTYHGDGDTYIIVVRSTVHKAEAVDIAKLSINRGMGGADA